MELSEMLKPIGAKFYQMKWLQMCYASLHDTFENLFDDAAAQQLLDPALDLQPLYLRHLLYSMDTSDDRAMDDTIWTMQTSVIQAS